jgi:hypothetical protein
MGAIPCPEPIRFALFFRATGAAIDPLLASGAMR